MGPGASQYINGNASLFQSLHECPKFSFSLPNGEVEVVSLKGVVTISDDITLTDVYYVPSFQVNLLSISMLTSHNDIIVQFSKTCAFIFDKVRMKNPSLIEAWE